MKSLKNLILLSFLPLMAILLSACSMENGQSGFFQTYFVSPFTNLILVTSHLFNDNYGLGIILVTILIRLLLMPLMLKQYKGQSVMRDKMNVLKPEMDKIQNKIKQTTDSLEKQNLQKEMMGLYQKHGVNPLNSIGCLPLLIQMPILMAFYTAIRNSHEIATHSFLWFDLGQPDIWITVFAGVVYYLQFKFTQSSLSVEQQSQMKYMGLLSPIMIVFVSFNAPAALPLYWVIGGVFIIFQSQIGKKLYPSPEKFNQKANL